VTGLADELLRFDRDGDDKLTNGARGVTPLDAFRASELLRPISNDSNLQLFVDPAATPPPALTKAMNWGSRYLSVQAISSQFAEAAGRDGVITRSAVIAQLSSFARPDGTFGEAEARRASTAFGALINRSVESWGGTSDRLQLSEALAALNGVPTAP